MMVSPGLALFKANEANIKPSPAASDPMATASTSHTSSPSSVNFLRMYP